MLDGEGRVMSEPRPTPARAGSWRCHHQLAAMERAVVNLHRIPAAWLGTTAYDARQHEQLVAALRIDLQDRLTVAEDALAGNPLDVVL